MSNLLQDLRYAFRQLRKTPGFAVVAVVTLALGIGANTAVFSVMDAVLLRSLPVRDPQQLVYLHTSNFPGGQTGYGDTSMRMQVYQALWPETRVFSDLMAWVPLGIGKVPVRFGKEPEEAQADMVSGNFFSGLGVPALMGRIFTVEDETQHAPIAILSYAYWNTRFNRDPAVIGQPFYIKGVPFTIVGVATRDFVGLDQGTSTDVWVPFQQSDVITPWDTAPDKRFALYGGDWWFLLTIGRLAPGVSQEQATAYLNPIFQRASVEGLSSVALNGAKPASLSLSDTRGMAGEREQYERPLQILLGMVVLVLMIACGNVAMLLVARNAARQREFSLRLALGGSRMRMFLQLLTESLLLVIAGAGLGWLFALWAAHQLAKWSLLERSLAPNTTVLLFTVLISAIAALIFGLAPLRTVVGAPMSLMLKAGAAASQQDHKKRRSGQLVVALQMSLCLVLLIGAGLLVRTLSNLENLNLGMKTSGLLVFGVNAQQHVHSDAEAINFYRSLLERMRTLPSVQSATLVRQRLGAGWSSNTTPYIDGQKPQTPKGTSAMRWNAVGPDFLKVFGIPLRLGRDFTDADSAAAPRVAIINETFAKTYLSNTTPIGHLLARTKYEDSPQYTIVGVAADSKYTGVHEKPLPMAYFPYEQVAHLGSTIQVELRTTGNPEALLPVARRAMQEFAPDLPLLRPRTQQDEFDEGLSGDRVFARLASFFGLLAVVLVATGLYGTLAYKVARRTAEIGVRMALGAQRYHVLWMVLGESLAICLAGVLIGLPAAIASARLLRSMLFDLQPGDPLTFIASLLAVVAVSLAASAVPAHKASTVDPMVALRCE